MIGIAGLKTFLLGSSSKTHSTAPQGRGVPGSAGRGLPFTRSRVGTWPVRLTQATGYSTPCDVRPGQGRNSGCGGDAMRSLALVIIVVVITVRFPCCPVKPPSSRPTRFAFFFPFCPPPRRGRADGVVSWPFVVDRGQAVTGGITKISKLTKSSHINKPCTA